MSILPDVRGHERRHHRTGPSANTGRVAFRVDPVSAPVEFYVSPFPELRIVEVSTVSGGPADGNSFVVSCEPQEEIDYDREALSEGGREGDGRVVAAGSTTASGWRSRWPPQTWGS
ncbi:MAG: hypothetical protein OXT72_15245 [Gammaproteobacteria bacterium]|nr:hypothetical protein [Gammaproteobacteria bacterium]MDE0248350.1 hypothetical protein [Gammaproteobacteria bacterium]